MLSRLLYRFAPRLWVIYIAARSSPLLLRLRQRPQADCDQLGPNKISEWADLRCPHVLATYADVLARRKQVRVEIVPESCLPGKYELVCEHYRSRQSHGGRPGQSRPMWPEGRWEYPWIIAHLAVQPGMHIADIGPENGFLPIYLASFGCEVYGIDKWLGAYGESFREGILAHCRRSGFELRVTEPEGRQGRVIYQEQDASHMLLEDASFERVISVSVIEHIVDDTAAIREMARILKPGGLLALTTPLGPVYRQGSELPHRKGPDGRWFGDLERVYSPEALRTRLVGPSGLELIGEPRWEAIDWSDMRRYQAPGQVQTSNHATAAVLLRKPAHSK